MLSYGIFPELSCSFIKNKDNSEVLKDITLTLSPDMASDGEVLKRKVAARAGLKPEAINDMRVVRKSVDARRRPVVLNLTVRIAADGDRNIEPFRNPVEFKKLPDGAPTLLIVGAGPAGLFGALECIRQGVKPIIIERGCDVDKRRQDLANISREKRINPNSNYCFGEGGAGAYSDGKLYTRSKKRGSVEEVLQLLVQHGATDSILVEAHPHVGSDKLPEVIKAIRNTILDAGGEVHFETLVDDIIIENGMATGVMTSKGPMKGDGVMLATGHSAHDTFRKLHSTGIAMEPKGIAIGVRLEHPQTIIDKIQYKSNEGRSLYLPPAEYSFVTQVDGRGVYSFCMCPGGVIVPAGSASGELVVNGMSASARSGKWANSGMVVEIHPGDLPATHPDSPLEMLDIQEQLEQKMFVAAGESIIAPAQRMKDFTDGKISKDLPRSSYAPGLQPADFSKILPPFISDRLKKGFLSFGNKAKGFLTNEAVLIGLESRTSSPVRILRDKTTLESISALRIFPAGEGAGYAGGIVSAAIDGMRCAKSFASMQFERDNADKVSKK